MLSPGPPNSVQAIDDLSSIRLFHYPGARLWRARCVLEADTRAEAPQRLRSLLAALWAVSPEAIEFYNLNDEVELIAESMGGVETGDHRFFEVGMTHGQAMYLGGSGHSLMLLHQSLDRVVAAYFSLPHRGEAGLRNLLAKTD